MSRATMPAVVSEKCAPSGRRRTPSISTGHGKPSGHTEGCRSTIEIWSRCSRGVVEEQITELLQARIGLVGVRRVVVNDGGRRWRGSLRSARRARRVRRKRASSIAASRACRSRGFAPMQDRLAVDVVPVDEIETAEPDDHIGIRRRERRRRASTAPIARNRPPRGTPRRGRRSARPPRSRTRRSRGVRPRCRLECDLVHAPPERRRDRVSDDRDAMRGPRRNVHWRRRGPRPAPRRRNGHASSAREGPSETNAGRLRDGHDDRRDEGDARRHDARVPQDAARRAMRHANRLFDQEVRRDSRAHDQRQPERGERCTGETGTRGRAQHDDRPAPRYTPYDTRPRSRSGRTPRLRANRASGRVTTAPITAATSERVTDMPPRYNAVE